MEHAVPSMTVNDCSIYYEMHGQGQDLVFIHGEDHGIEMFAEQVKFFSENYRCLTYYRRGHGRSELPPYGYSLHNQTEDLVGLLRHLAIERPIVVAVAMATPIAVSYALADPQRVRALTLASWYELHGCPLMEGRRRAKYTTTFAQLHMQMYEIIRNDGADALIRHMEQQGDLFLPILPKDPALRMRVMRMMSSHVPEHYRFAAELYSSMPNLVPRLKEITCPILGICGDDDPCPDQPELLGGQSNFQQVWIPGARRFGMIENPAAFNAALVDFLAALPQ